MSDPYYLIHAFDLLIEAENLMSDALYQEFVYGDEWRHDLPPLWQVMEEAEQRYKDMMNHFMVTEGLYQVDKPIRDGTLICLIPLQTELGERVLHLAQYGIAWDFEKSRPHFKTSYNDMMDFLRREERYGTASMRDKYGSDELEKWFSVFPKKSQMINDLIQQRTWTFAAAQTRSDGLYWDSAAHRIDIAKSLEFVDQTLAKEAFSIEELGFIRCRITACRKYFTNASEVEDRDDDITIEVLSRYLVDGNYVREIA